jgi:acyl carrier protein
VTADVEAALAAHAEVERAAVAVMGNEVDQQVVALVVPAAGTAPEGPGLRRHLAAALPGAALPDLFVLVDRLPSDPGALTAATRGGDGDAPLAILGGPAADVADIWREVLHRDAVTLADDLFDLGGTSMAITRIAVRVRSRMGVEVPLETFYDTPTIPGIAAAVEALAGRPSPLAGEEAAPRPEGG